MMDLNLRRRAANEQEIQHVLVGDEDNDVDIIDIINEQVDPIYNDIPENEEPGKYITPPIITPASRLDQLREPALDVLAPVTTEDYRPAPPRPQARNSPAVVTCTVIEVIH